MKLKLTVLLLAGLLLNACGDKTASSSSLKIFAVRSLEDSGQNSNGANLQVALLDANQINSEEDAQEAVQNAQWVSIDDFSNDNIVFREEDEEGPEFASVTYAGHRGYHRRGPRRCDTYVHRRRHRHRGCWRPYFRDHWVNWRPPIYRDCPRGYLRRRSRCVLPYTVVYNYWWRPRHTYYTRLSVSWNNRHRRRGHHHRRRHHRRHNDGRFRVSFYF